MPESDRLKRGSRSNQIDGCDVAGTPSRTLSALVRFSSCCRRSGFRTVARKAIGGVLQGTRRVRDRSRLGSSPSIRSLSRASVERELAPDGVSSINVTRADLARFFEQSDYPYYYYRGKRRFVYGLWHYLGFQLTDLQAGQIVVDVGAQAGTWSTIARRLYKCRSYDLDIEYRSGIHGCRIGAGADAMPFGDGEVSYLVSFCAFNCFEGDADIRFAQEAARCLKEDGAVVIVPLCLTAEHTNIYDPLLGVPEASFDEGARREPWYGWGNRFGRWYSPRLLRERFLSQMPGARVELYEVLHDLEDVPWPGAMFCMVVRKSGRQAHPS